MKVGNKIRKTRELRNFTQEYMAEKLNISQSAYSRMEQEESDISFSRLAQISKILNMNLTDLLNFDEGKVLIQHNALHEHSQGFVFQQQEGLAEQERKQYEARISSLEKEIERLHGLLEKALTK